MTRVGYLGPAGTFTEEALRATAPGQVEAVPYATVHETVMAVAEGATERAVVPIENSLEGSVAATLDVLASEAARVSIVAEVARAISHCLVAREGVSIDDPVRVLSHPQALAQCAGFLRDRLPAAERVLTVSTADAVRLVCESAEPWAAIGSRASADLYGCAVLAEGIEDGEGSITRFVWLGPAGTPAADPTKTSIVFWGFADESPGALVDVLSEVSRRGVNMTKIESRPRRVRLGHYMFFADLDGPADSTSVGEAVESLRAQAEVVRVLGSYPAARIP